MYDAACSVGHAHIKTADDLLVFLEHVHTSGHRERGEQITTTDVPALGIAKNLVWIRRKRFGVASNWKGSQHALFARLWNSSADTLARHRNHLFGIDLPLEYVLPDELHRMHLVVFQIFVHTVLWDLIICNVWRASHGMGVQESDANGGLRLENEWCMKEKAARGPSPRCQTSPSRTWVPETGELKAKPAVSSTLLSFAIDMFEKHKAHV